MNCKRELAYIGKYLGGRIDLVQAGGGNISIKEDGILHIKSSGCILSEVEEDYGLSEVSLYKALEFNNKIEDINEDQFGSKLSELLVNETFKRPSIETPLHTLLPHKVVIHVHPITILSLVSQKNSDEILSKLFQHFSFINYATPGKKLAINFKEQANTNHHLYFMENHGIVISHNTVSEALKLLDEVIDTAEKFLNVHFDHTPSRISEIFTKSYNKLQTAYMNSDNELISILKSQKYSPLCPDDIIFITHDILEVSNLTLESSIKDFYSKYGSLPKAIFFNNNLYFTGNNLYKAKQVYEQFYASLKAASLQKNNQFITEVEKTFLLNWEAEKYRQKN